jgi:hypothetical protein
MTSRFWFPWRGALGLPATCGEIPNHASFCTIMCRHAQMTIKTH